MDYVLYNVFGYATHNLASEAASKIQRAYRNHKRFELAWRTAIIHNRAPTHEDNDDCEVEYWQSQRAQVRHESQWVEI